MDKIIELAAFYWAEWQLDTVEIPHESTALIALAFLILCILVVLSRLGKIAKLIRQLIQEKNLLEQSNKKHEELLSQQKNDAEKIADFQQQLTQSNNQLQQEKEKHQAVIVDKETLFIKSANDKKLEVETLNTALQDKNQLVKQLQKSLDELKNDTTEYTNAQEKVEELNNQLASSTVEFNKTKQQLEAELANTKQIQEQLSKKHLDQVTALERQLKNQPSGTSKIAEQITTSPIEPITPLVNKRLHHQLRHLK